MAPEALQYHIYSVETDCFAFGIVLWEIATLGMFCIVSDVNYMFNNVNYLQESHHILRYLDEKYSEVYQMVFVLKFHLIVDKNFMIQ